ncbi:MAG: GAF domain-containing protein [Chloroflexi bacterium]|nr:GAF domain-containing protein [Chloroflexota bacterium]
MNDEQPIRILFVEDVPFDAELAERVLRKEGLVFTSARVDTRDDFLAALTTFQPDLIISDYTLPEFDGLQALKLSLEYDPALPVILMTGSLNEETAVHCIKSGATDYVLKDRITRLPFAVKEALEQKQTRLAKDAAERALRESEARYRLLFDTSMDAVLLTAPDGRIFAANPAACQMFGQTEAELIQVGRDGVVDASDPRLELALAERARTGRFIGEIALIRKDGAQFPSEISTAIYHDNEGRVRSSMIIRDITDRKRAEDTLRQRVTELELLYESGLALRQLLSPREIGQKIIDLLAQKLAWHHTTVRLYHPHDETLELLAFEQSGLTNEAERHAVEERFKTLIARSGDGLCGWVVQHGQTVRTGDLAHDPRYVETAPDLRSGLYVPMKVGKRVIGVISVEDQRIDAFSEADERLTATLAAQAASALENARLFGETRQRLTEMEALHTISAALRAAPSHAEMLPVIVHVAFDVLKAAGAALALRVPANDELIVVYGQGVWVDRTGTRLPPGARIGVIGHVIATGRTYSNADVDHEPRLLLAERWDELQGVAAAPLITQEQIVGALIVGRPTDYSDEEARLLAAIADIAANALQRAEVLGTLEQRVADRTRELAAANERLQELDRLKSKFVSDVSHELRTPVTSMSLYIDLLDHGKPEKRDFYITQLEQQMTRLRAMINEILDLARLERDQHEISLTPIDLNAIVEHVVATQQVAAGAAGLQLICEVTDQMPLVLAQPEQLGRAVTNVAANAIKYTRSGTVRVTTDTSDDRVCVSVTDTGIGIAPEDVPHVFERFYRGQPVAQSNIPGTGLGLAIVKEIVEAHGGTVQVESELGVGSTFRLWLPAMVG